MDRSYELSINPQTAPFGPYSLDLIPAPKSTGLLTKNTYANRVELSDALDRLGIEDSEKISILHFLDRGDIYRILSFPVPDEVAITFGWVFDHEPSINHHCVVLHSQPLRPVSSK